ncbi:membrane-spanning 4-domains subfamily A member 5-like [Hoplias malabaricus]|uniref:membrane-spanning 4-domains subfamily A member 5-like n=1 Tax=Hoplias malabaricus TaxID=27720 RepID=UPI003461CE15
MSIPAVPFTNIGSGHAMVTHVICPQTTTQPGLNMSSNSPLQRFLKGEPKALGTFQIVTGLITFLSGIVLLTQDHPPLTVLTGLFIWASLMYIATGALAVSASNRLNKSKVNGSLVMNVLSAIAAGVAIILLCFDTLIDWDAMCMSKYGCRKKNLINGIAGVLLVFTVVQFIVSLCISVFACKASCSNEPVVNVTVVSNPGGFSSVVNPLPQQPAPSNQQLMNIVSGVSLSSPPMENPPMYSPPQHTEVKDQQGNKE